MALTVLLRLPETREECPGAYKFWRCNYESLVQIFLKLFDSADLNIRALTFDASVKLVRLLHLGKFEDKFDKLLQTMIRFLPDCHRDAQTHIVEPRMMDLVELAKGYTDNLLKRLNFVLSCLFQIVEIVDDDTTFFKCQAIEIIKILHDRDFRNVSKYLVDLSNESKRRMLNKCVRLICRIADAPTCYDLDAEHTRNLGGSKTRRVLTHSARLPFKTNIITSLCKRHHTKVFRFTRLAGTSCRSYCLYYDRK
ncbi:hypothetical protein K1719_029222 [Acacia pycnantha]|nr:hypothetical protein K1719_029222 [Acacia pycnantha]